LVHIEPNGRVSVWSRYGDAHKKFSLNNTYRDEILDALNIEKGVEYWLDSEVMNKTANATSEIVFYDVLHAGRYLFGSPDQMVRLEMLRQICGDPQTLEPGGLALQITPRLWMAETFLDHFVDRFNESLDNPKIEGLVLRKRAGTLDHFGNAYYETPNIIRCRRPFAKDKGYNF